MFRLVVFLNKLNLKKKGKLIFKIFLLTYQPDFYSLKSLKMWELKLSNIPKLIPLNLSDPVILNLWPILGKSRGKKIYEFLKNYDFLRT